MKSRHHYPNVNNNLIDLVGLFVTTAFNAGVAEKKCKVSRKFYLADDCGYHLI